MHNSVADQLNSSCRERSQRRGLVELTAIDVQCSEINVVWRLPQPLAWDVVLLRPVSEFQNNMPLISRDALFKQKPHR